MTLRISFELDDNDLKHFRLIMDEARLSAQRIEPEDIVGAAEALLQEVPRQGAPSFIVERLNRLRMMIDMLSDIEWRLPHPDATGWLDNRRKELQARMRRRRGRSRRLLR